MRHAAIPDELAEHVRGDIIFATLHGSQLYGFDTEPSDEDWFVVTTSAAPAPATRSSPVQGCPTST